MLSQAGLSSELLLLLATTTVGTPYAAVSKPLLVEKIDVDPAVVVTDDWNAVAASVFANVTATSATTEPRRTLETVAQSEVLPRE